MIRRAAPALFSVVLASFLLPWMSISCSGQTLVTATGAQVLTGSYHFPQNDALTALMPEGSTSSAMPAANEQLQGANTGRLRLGAGVVLLSALLGLVLTFRNTARMPLLVLCFGSLQSAVLLAAMVLLPSWMTAAMQENQAAAAAAPASGSDPYFALGEAMGRQIGERLAGSIKLEFGFGYYLALGASLALCGLGLYLWRRLSLVGSPEPEGVSVHADMDTEVVEE